MGPGGTLSFTNKSYSTKFYGDSIGNQFWMLEPANPKPDSAFVMVYCYGFMYFDSPEQIMAALVPLVSGYAKRGYTIVVPYFQNRTFEPNKEQIITLYESSLAAAFRELDNQGHVKPFKDSNGNIIYSLVGYSFGGMFAWMGAAYLDTTEVPFPKSITTFAAGNWYGKHPVNRLPPETKLALQVGYNDTEIKSFSISDIWPQLSQHPCENKILISVMPNSGISDADHNYHQPFTLDANDYYASDKYAIGMADCALKGKNCEYVLTNYDSITFMGKYSDGTPLKPMQIYSGGCSAIRNPATLFSSDSTTMNFNQKKSSHTTMIICDGNWEISTANDWIKVYPESGIFTHDLRVTVNPNESTISRTGFVLLTSPGKDTISIQVNQIGNNTTAIEEFKQQKRFSITPNPINGNLLYLKGLSSYQVKYRILSTDGQIVLSEKIKTGFEEQPIDVSYLKKGIYILELRGLNNVTMLRFIKK